MNELMADARKRKGWRFDRFARSPRLGEFRSLGTQFISYQENIDTSSPLGQAIFTIVSAVAQLERDLIRERVIAGMRSARACGRHLGRPRRIVNHDEVRWLRSEGASLRQIAEKLGVGYGTVRLRLRDAFDLKWKENSMLIRNNKGEVIGEMNTTIAREGTVIKEQHELLRRTSRSFRISPSTRHRAMFARGMFSGKFCPNTSETS